jgi:hypothetical protein
MYLYEKNEHLCREKRENKVVEYGELNLKKQFIEKQFI